MGLKEKTNWIVGDIECCARAVLILFCKILLLVFKNDEQIGAFIIKSLELGNTIYSFHKGGESNRAFIKRFIEEHGGKITNIFPVQWKFLGCLSFTQRKNKLHTWICIE